MARKMKDSGIEWIGEIPEGWELTKVKRIFDIGRGRVISQQELTSVGYPVYSSQTKNNGCLGYISTYDFDKSQLTWTTDGVNAGTVFLREGKYNCTNVCGTLAPKNDTNDLHYLKYALEYIAFYHKRADINGFKIMNNEMAEIELLLPPLFEQQNIANYLDFKCSQTQSILEQSLFSIEEYKKLKQAVITQAVTKGVRGEREMKDSGVDYIGQIPAEWVLGKLRNVGDTQNGISESSEFFGKGFPFVSYSDVYKNYSLPSTVSGLVDSTSEEQKRYSVKKGDIFFTRTSETIEEVGFSCVCEKDIPNATFAGFLIRVRPFSDKLYTPYAKYYFRSSHLRFYLVKEMNLVTRASLGQSLLKSMPVLLPPLEEQKEIADYLDTKCAEIDGLIAKKDQLVKELESYKKSLIYEVVTGKREV